MFIFPIFLVTIMTVHEEFALLFSEKIQLGERGVHGFTKVQWAISLAMSALLEKKYRVICIISDTIGIKQTIKNVLRDRIQKTSMDYGSIAGIVPKNSIICRSVTRAEVTHSSISDAELIILVGVKYKMSRTMLGAYMREINGKVVSVCEISPVVYSYVIQE